MQVLGLTLQVLLLHTNLESHWNFHASATLQIIMCQEVIGTLECQGVGVLCNTAHALLIIVVLVI